MNLFANLYPVQKTLRFELKPVGETLDRIVKSGLLEEDEQRAEDYKKVKKIIDEYHKAFISKALKDFKLNYVDNGEANSLEEYFAIFQKNKETENQSEADRKKIKKQQVAIQKNLRKQIVKRFEEMNEFKTIFKKELIEDDLPSFVKSTEERLLVSKFEKFTTYFGGFHINRKNMYSDEDQSTAISYRLIHENLPKFIDNLLIFNKKVKATRVSDHFKQLYTDFQSYLNVHSIEEMFTLAYFNEVMTQEQIDVYNAIIGGRSEEQGKPKIQGLNEYINLYNQQQTEKKDRLPKLKPLFKQILSDKNAISWLPEEFGSDQELLESVGTWYDDLYAKVFVDRSPTEPCLEHLLYGISEFELSLIYLRNDTSITQISQGMFGDWSIINRAIEADFKRKFPLKKNETSEKYDKRRDDYLKSFDSFSIAYLNDCLKAYGEPYAKRVDTYFATLGASQADLSKPHVDCFAQVREAYEQAKDLLTTPYPSTRKLAQEKRQVEKIKSLLDAVKLVQWFVKPLLGSGTEAYKQGRFYGEFSYLWEELNQITSLYNMVRNYMTKKPYSMEKFKLNFENPILLHGWDVNMESKKSSVILRKEGIYYLGIMQKKNKGLFKQSNLAGGTSYYEKMEYKYFGEASNTFPHVLLSKSGIKMFTPSAELLKNYEKGTHTKGDNFRKQDCHDLIDFFKRSIQRHKDWSIFDFQFSDTASYEDISGFYREVDRQGYKISFRDISENQIDQWVAEGKLFLFQIYNKDFSPHSKGTPNLHTLYWKMLFDEENLADVVYRLNGQAEVFFRKLSINHENRIVHPANQPIVNKNEQNEKEKSTFKYDIIKDRRFTVDTFHFHVPITMNFKARGITNINPLVNQYIKEGGITHVIGIDRGERHLLYLSLVDLQGNIIDQYSLNEIVNEYKGNEYRTNYRDLLDKKEKERQDARKSWLEIENIQELKEGYLSQVIHKIASLMTTYNAIVVIEDLSRGFIRGRQKVEKQVYQKFEKRLIDKLNYLVDKSIQGTKPGGLLKAYQFTNILENLDKMGKQNGLLFYIPAWNTSKMDPTTGFVNLFDTKYESVEKSKQFFEKFDRIRYNSEKDYFEFETTAYSRFNGRAEGTRQHWVICAHGTRIENYQNKEANNQWCNREMNLTEEFKRMFDTYGVDYQSNLKESICERYEKDFFKSLLSLFKLTVQMRNSFTGTDIDYMISPVMNQKGTFFDSRVGDKLLPKDADANGAYNIARKGLWAIDQIKQASDLSKVKLEINNKEWLQYAQRQNG
ncbi:hypothetical protein MASR1M31_02260 [Porphyromonadaceae bacterium]